MNDNAQSNEEIIHDTQMLQKYKDKVVNGVQEINEDQELTSTEFSEYIGHVNQKKVTELRIISCFNMKLDRCPKQSVKSLTINKCHLKDVSGIQVMTQLTQLNLSLNQISDISLLAQLTNLTALDLGQNNIECAKVLSNFKQLVSLDLSENLIADISPLRDLLQMQILDVSYNKLQNINDLGALTNIKHLNITQTNISNIDCLAKMTKMTHLLMSSNKIISIQILKSFPELYDVRLENNFIQDFEPIAKHKFANKNWVREQKVPTETDFMNSFGCDQQEVTLLIKKSKQQKEMSDNKYMLIKKYEKDVKNTSLRINGEKQLNNLQFTDVLKLTELEAINSQTIHFAEDQVPTLLLKLKLNNCTFKHEHMNLNPITGIYQMEQLVELDLTSNRILDVSEIGNLTNLQKLYLQNNDIHRINELRSLSKLTHVNLQNNKIIFSEPLIQLKVELQIDNNLIADSVTFKNQQQPQPNHFKAFLGPNSSDDQINELATVTSDVFYSVKMKSKYVQSVQNSALNIQNDAELEDFGFSTDLNIKSLSVKDCQNVKLPRTLVNHLQGTIEKYQEVKPTKLPTQITSLSIANSKLTNLNGLELLTQLQKIQLINNPITSFKPILGLSKMNSLTINSAKLTDFSGLNQMKQLIELDLGSNQIQEIDQIADQLKGLSNLKKFSMHNNNIHRVNALRGLQQLSYLNVSSNKIIFSEPLNQLKVELQIDNNLVTDNITLKNQQQPQLNHFKAFLGPNSSDDQINELATVTSDVFYSVKMKSKYVQSVQNSALNIQNDAELEDFGFSTDLNIKSLSVKDCQNVKLPRTLVNHLQGTIEKYQEVKPTKLPTQITSLSIANSKLTNLNGLELLTQLQKIQLINNPITSFKPILGLSKMNSLTINSAKLTDFSGLNQMKQLIELDLGSNQIQEIDQIADQLKGLSNLKKFSMHNNNIHRVNALRGLQQLSYLNVSSNKIIFSEPLNQLKVELQIDNNLVTDNITLKNQQQPQLNHFKAFLGPNSSDDQINELATVTSDVFYSVKMKSKYVQSVQNSALNIQNDAELEDFGFSTDLNIKSLSVKDCQNVKLPRTLVNHLQGTIEKYQEVKPTKLPTQITSLSIANSKLTNLNGLELLTQLQKIQLINNPITSFKPILGLSKMNSLTINSAKLTDFSGLNQMKQLIELDLGSNQIQEIDQIADQLKGLSNLKKFSMHNNNIHRVNALRGLQQLSYLNVSSNKIIFSEPLNQLKVELQIDNNLVTDNITLKNQQQPQLNHFKAFLAPNSSNDQISELCEYANYQLLMNQKYKNQVQNQTLSVQNDNNLTDFAFTSDLNVINLSLLNCQNVKMPSNVKYCGVRANFDFNKCLCNNCA
ncbi:Conserved_hypothetical protein [Hexamita inflata]|uniref:Uncharacterized protein n=1 Tax=Hexamita inflata TaxID=28002 RepID=A0AA86N5J9_9EUKA|nr:Conserved hypothetical protein [Hexamita inflata]